MAQLCVEIAAFIHRHVAVSEQFRQLAHLFGGDGVFDYDYGVVEVTALDEVTLYEGHYLMQEYECPAGCYIVFEFSVFACEHGILAAYHL